MSSELKVRTIILLEEIRFPAYFDFGQGVRGLGRGQAAAHELLE